MVSRSLPWFKNKAERDAVVADDNWTCPACKGEREPALGNRTPIDTWKNLVDYAKKLAKDWQDNTQRDELEARAMQDKAVGGSAHHTTHELGPGGLVRRSSGRLSRAEIEQHMADNA